MPKVCPNRAQPPLPGPEMSPLPAQNGPTTSVRAEGVEPSCSFEHRHLKPARIPFRHARSVPIVPPQRSDPAPSQYVVAIYRKPAVASLDEFVGPKS